MPLAAQKHFAHDEAFEPFVGAAGQLLTDIIQKLSARYIGSETKANAGISISGEGTAADVAGGNSGTLENGVAFAPGVVGRAFSFDGIDDGLTHQHHAGSAAKRAIDDVRRGVVAVDSG